MLGSVNPLLHSRCCQRARSLCMQNTTASPNAVRAGCSSTGQLYHWHSPMQPYQTPQNDEGRRRVHRTVLLARRRDSLPVCRAFRQLALLCNHVLTLEGTTLAAIGGPTLRFGLCANLVSLHRHRGIRVRYDRLAQVFFPFCGEKCGASAAPRQNRQNPLMITSTCISNRKDPRTELHCVCRLSRLTSFDL